MKRNSKIDHREKALFLQLIPARELIEVNLSSYLKDNSKYCQDLIDSIYYSMITNPESRYYYNWIKKDRPNVVLKDKCLFIDKQVLLISYTDLYSDCSSFPTMDKLKNEILWMLKYKLD